jgi:hypothetical protein
MAKVKDLTIEDLEFLIEQKVLEILGDPDSDLDLKPEFKRELSRRLGASSRWISHEDIVRKFGEGSLD